MDDGDRAAPVALARDAPVAQAELHFLFAQAFCGEVGGDGVHRLRRSSRPSYLPELMHTPSLACIPFLPIVCCKFRSKLSKRFPEFFVIRVARTILPCVSFSLNSYPYLSIDDLLDRHSVFLGKTEIAFVMRRHRHHRAFAVAHQHIVADPYRHLFAGERMRHRDIRRHALLFHGGDVGFGHAAVFAFFDECSECRVLLRGIGRQRMLGCHGDESHAHDGVGAGGVDPQLVLLAVQLIREGEAHAVALADPVGLHGLHLLRPAGQRVEILQQFVGVLGDAEEIHRDVALLDHGAGAPAAAVDDLLVGQHGVVHRVPVHHRGLLIDDTLLEQAREQPLLPAVIVRLAGGHFARPVHAQAQRLQLLLHVLDVGIGPGGGRHVVGHRGILGRQAESVPAHRLHHVVALHLVIAAKHVADGVVAHMAHVQLARRVGEHRQAIVFRFAAVFVGAERLGGLPLLLGGGFDIFG